MSSQDKDKAGKSAQNPQPGKSAQSGSEVEDPVHGSDQAHTTTTDAPTQRKRDMSKDKVLTEADEHTRAVLEILLAKRARRGGEVGFVRYREKSLAETVAVQRSRLEAAPVTKEDEVLFGVEGSPVYRDFGVLAQGKSYGENVFQYKDNTADQRIQAAQELTRHGVQLNSKSHPLNADEIPGAGISVERHREMRKIIMSNMDKKCADRIIAMCCQTSPLAREVDGTKYNYFADYTVGRSYQLALITLAHNCIAGTHVWPCTWLDSPLVKEKRPMGKQVKPPTASSRLNIQGPSQSKHAFPGTTFEVVPPTPAAKPKRTVAVGNPMSDPEQQLAMLRVMMGAMMGQN